jgi:hypothetical protein
MVQASLGKMQDPISKISGAKKKKKGLEMWLKWQNKREALSLNPTTTKK